jgi:transposase
MRPYDYSYRIRAIELYEQGSKKIRISEELGVNYYTLLNWIKRYEEDGKAGLMPDYSKCGQSSTIAEHIKAEAIKMKGDHPEWGSDYIRMKLRKKYPSTWLASSRQFRRYFVQAGVSQTQASKLPKAAGENSWAKREFYRVQVDAKEQLQTQDGKWSSYLTFTDEKSGAVLDAFVFPP